MNYSTRILSSSHRVQFPIMNTMLQTRYGQFQVDKTQTKAVRDALNGRKDQVITQDYRTVRVLAAYTPIKFHNVTYALIAEIDEAEAFQKINNLKLIVTSFAGLIALFLFFISWKVALRFTKPITELTISSIEISKGNLEQNSNI